MDVVSKGKPRDWLPVLLAPSLLMTSSPSGQWGLAMPNGFFAPPSLTHNLIYMCARFSEVHPPMGTGAHRPRQKDQIFYTTRAIITHDAVNIRSAEVKWRNTNRN